MARAGGDSKYLIQRQKVHNQDGEQRLTRLQVLLASIQGEQENSGAVCGEPPLLCVAAKGAGR
jgi:hypothetical protein